MERGWDGGREGCTDGWMVGWMDGWMDGWMGGWRDGGRDRSMKEYAMKLVRMFGASHAVFPPMDGIDRMSTSLPNMDSID